MKMILSDSVMRKDTTPGTIRRWSLGNKAGRVPVGITGLIIGAVFAILFLAPMGASAQVTETFDAPGTYSFTVPNGVTSVTVRAWGAGGGGGGRGGVFSGSGGGGGGGGGAYAEAEVTVESCRNYSVVVGAGGAGGPAGDNNGSNGGDSFFDDGLTVLARGGTGGVGGVSGSGGSGGAEGDSVGTKRFSGGNGAAGTGSASGGGGGGAGTSGNGGNASGTTAGAGASLNGGTGGTGRTDNGIGNPGLNYGGAGSGASRFLFGGGPFAGGNGGNGRVEIEYTLPPTPSYSICGSPGRDAGPTDGIVNSYFPTDDGTYSSTSCSIGLGTRRGAAIDPAPGDLLIVMQMQCADMDTTNTANYGGGDGTGRGYSDPVGSCLAGQYEYVVAGPDTDNTSLDLSLSPLVGTYIQDPGTIANRRTFQVIRVPQYFGLTLTGDVTSAYWDGSTGGVVAMDIYDELDLGGFTIDVLGRGFRGAGAVQWSSANTDTNVPPDYRRIFDVSNALRHAHKGEGLAGTPRYVHDQETGARVDLGAAWGGYIDGDTGRGAPGNAGGGGNNRNGTRDNGGGGGGGNGGIGGNGGYGWKSGGWGGVFGSGDFDLRGIGGAAFASPAPNRVVMGGGGGAGGTNNDGNTNPRAKGGAGGGIVIVRAGSMTGTGTVDARGADGETMPVNDAGGGGGAGGSVVLMAYNSGLGAVTADVRGGAGGDSDLGGVAHGGGGGGAGGVVFRSGTATVNDAGANNGITALGGDPVGGASHGATPGGNGIDTETTDSSFNVWPGALCPPTAVVMGNVDLAVVNIPDYLHGVGAYDRDREGLLEILRAWDPQTADILENAGFNTLLQALADYLDPDGDGLVVVLRWETLEERGTIGFYAERLQDGVWVRINHEMLPGLIASPMGAQYWLADPGARPGDDYRYRLIEVEARGTTREYGPFDLGGAAASP